MEKITYRDLPQCFENNPNICRNWNYSKDRLNIINQKLNEKIPNLDCCIALAGSYGRYEASEISDLDYIILSKEKETADIADKALRELSQELKIKLPKEDGVFSNFDFYDDLLNSIGNPKESINILSKRMLILMETVPIYNYNYFKKFIDDVLKKYLILLEKFPQKEAVFLLNDLIRYFRTICVNYENTFLHEYGKWALRNIKLKHSRILIYAGLLFVILGSSKETDKIKFIEMEISYTPMERIVHLLQKINSDYSTITKKYDFFLGEIIKKETQECLRDLEYEKRKECKIFLELNNNAHEFQKNLVDFIFENLGAFSTEIITYLIF